MRLPGSRRDRLQVAIIINQLATPGLGSWVTGHRIAGTGQLIIAFTGFFMVVAPMVRVIIDSIAAILRDADGPVLTPDSWQAGLLLFGVSWVWAGVTSLQMFAEIRQINRNPPNISSSATPADSAPPHLRRPD